MDSATAWQEARAKKSEWMSATLRREGRQKWARSLLVAPRHDGPLKTVGDKGFHSAIPALQGGVGEQRLAGGVPRGAVGFVRELNYLPASPWFDGADA